MDKTVSVGGLILMFIAVVVCVGAFIPQIFSNQAAMTGNYTADLREQVGAVANGGTVDLVGQTYLAAGTILNVSGADIDCSNNYTIASSVSPVTGVKTVRLTNVGNATGPLQCHKVNITYSYGGAGYIEDSGGRTMAGLIGLFAALAILAGLIYYWYKEYGSYLFNF